MKLSFLLFLILSGTLLKSNAQQDSVVIPDPDEFQRHSHFYIGAPFINFNATHYPHLRQAFKSQGIGYSAVQFNTIASFGGALQRGRYKLGAEAIYGLPGSDTKKPTKVTGSYIAYSLNAGYAVIFERNRQYFINIGVGRVESTVSVYSTDTPQTLAFNNLLSAPIVGQSPALVHKNTFLEVSLERTIRPTRPVSLNPVFRIGYRLGINTVPWKTDNNISLTNAPVDRIHQVFVQSIFVISKSHKRKLKF
ncbi:hypothetical protein [Runella slithyformis]|uniref:Outer membrane protein beta-barrel domain-containing protein n=1 Tax=Runella slithyformis (strain ATCC 29530 / DSM 19594 / LMG 11500 / NCIMB 11436 / LSU 4) TaxID=761193 RepID=A0A7U3ZIK5_RUNSL|nr:hypothetical protein [Runella slithyformis]AEI47815.1 hypothetical protein Runsl_1389 [Runella slithyformis DSM 19594]